MKGGGGVPPLRNPLEKKGVEAKKETIWRKGGGGGGRRGGGCLNEEGGEQRG